MEINTIETQRSFILGDRWLYYKIYTGAKTADLVLAEIIKPLAEQLIDLGIIDKWFFIRYSDPKQHIRVRFHYTNPQNIGLIINTLYPHLKDFIDQDLIWKIQLDTYQREIERYGINTIELAEDLFYYDSKMIVDFLDMIDGEEGEEYRWLFSLRAIDSLLDAFKYNDNEKLILLESLKVGFRSEFDSSSFLGKQLNDKYRNLNKKISTFMNFTSEDDLEYVSILDLIYAKEEAIKPIVTVIEEHQKNGRLQRSINDLMGSYIHMLMNRLFKSNNRMHEMVCYDFLYRYYNSMIARKKHQEKKLELVK